MTGTHTQHSTSTDPVGTRVRWPLTGVLAGALGFVATMVADLRPSSWQGETITPAVLDDVSRVSAHLSVAAGYLAVALLVLLAAQWQRHVEPRVPTSVAARVVSNGFIASAGALALGYGYKGMLAVYLPGGLDEGNSFDREGLYVMFVLNDFASFIGWIGVVIAAGAVAWMALRERTVSRWIGVLSLLPLLGVMVMVASTGLPGFQGIVAPAWLVVASLGLAFGRSTVVR